MPRITHDPSGSREEKGKGMRDEKGKRGGSSFFFTQQLCFQKHAATAHGRKMTRCFASK